MDVNFNSFVGLKIVWLRWEIIVLLIFVLVFCRIWIIFMGDGLFCLGWIMRGVLVWDCVVVVVNRDFFLVGFSGYE